MAFSKATRQVTIETLQQVELDVLIIGGGITGAGVALQASAAGMKSGLIEMQDFAEGTSSRSTKLVHGGIRYLTQFDVELVADTVKERAVVQRIAPHIPKPDPMLMPVYDETGATFNLFTLKVAMDLYDHLAGITDSEYGNYLLSKAEVFAREPNLKADGLLGAGVYLDYSNNDARLVIENIKQAAAFGGHLVNRVEAVGLLYSADGTIRGVTAKDLVTGEVFEIKARLVLNTAGPWVDHVRQLSESKVGERLIRPTKGVHLVVAHDRFPVPQPMYFDTGKGDGRMVLAIPRETKTYFGTTDTDYQGDYTKPTITQGDVDYLLDVINFRYPSLALTLADIEASWAGLRPLVSTNAGSDYIGGKGRLSDTSFESLVDTVNKFQGGEVERSRVEEVVAQLDQGKSGRDPSPSSVSRGSELFRDDDGLITLAGGKLTDYRKMASGAMAFIRDILEDEYQQVYQLVDSRTLPVSGGDFDPERVKDELQRIAGEGVPQGLSEKEALTLAHLYGSNARLVYQLADTVKQAPGLSLAETLGLHYSLRHEMVLTPADYLVRRTNYLLFMRETLDQVKESIIREMARYFKWTIREEKAHRVDLEKVIEQSDLRELKEKITS